jgi:hypothetical protein
MSVEAEQFKKSADALHASRSVPHAQTIISTAVQNAQ